MGYLLFNIAEEERPQFYPIREQQKRYRQLYLDKKIRKLKKGGRICVSGEEQQELINQSLDNIAPWRARSNRKG